MLGVGWWGWIGCWQISAYPTRMVGLFGLCGSAAVVVFWGEY